MTYVKFVFEQRKLRENFLSHNKAKGVFELIHCDIWGPYREPSSNGAHYF